MLKNININLAPLGCGACAMKIEKGLDLTEGVKTASVDFAESVATVSYDPNLVNENQIQNTIVLLGYDVLSIEEK